MDRIEPDTAQWLLLVGAMLGNKAVVTQVTRKIAPESVPQPLRTLWAALKFQEPENVKIALEGFGVPKNGEGSVTSLIHAIQKRLIREYIKSNFGRGEGAARLLDDPAAAADFFEKIALTVRAMQSQIEEKK